MKRWTASITAAAALASLAAAAPMSTSTQEQYSSSSNCEQYGSVPTGVYTVYNNLWGQSNANSGSQCFSVTSLSSDVLAWSTTWSWTGGANDVKSYANAVLTSLTSSSPQLSSVKSMKSEWDWSYNGTDLVADVAYDMFTSSTSGGSEEYEIMVWLAALGGAGPISAKYGSDGNATSIATTTLCGTSWNLYKGSNGAQTVFSFVPADGSHVTNFSGDVLQFFTYLISDQGFEKAQYLVSAGAGTEAFTGSEAAFTTNKYSLSVVA
ncbi:glycoside hydrolase family 12 [Lecanosticta acicola]|uniref:Glycoside hydrolase family 12 n=1 Tax=Lecanosticta acicola TaxID=111012 RepID=A0AAI8Z0J0_9PEZI|nr:glycoside hydrolase family 12 [Lecanosticta acicola]